VADYCSAPDTLTLAIAGGPSLDLLSDQQGLRVASLDLGYPAVREDENLRPDAQGTIDLTRLFGARAVTINGALVPSPAGSRQASWHKLAPFLDPGQRLTLTYRVDGDVVTKTMTVRAAQATATFDNPTTSPVQLGFKAADPRAYDINVQTAIAGIATAGGAGRAYNLTFNRVYPAGATAGVTTASAGDLAVYPTLRFYGPMQNINLLWTAWPPGTQRSFAFVSSYLIPAGSYVAVDCRARTAYLNGDPTNNVYGQLVAFNLWPYIPANGSTTWALQATNYTGSSQVQITWADAYLV
jgi:hypothetical protein